MWLLIILILALIILFIKMNHAETQEHFWYYPNCIQTVTGSIRCYPYSYYYPLHPWNYFYPSYWW